MRLHREAIGALRLSALEPAIAVGAARAVTPRERALLLAMLSASCRGAPARKALARARRPAPPLADADGGADGTAGAAAAWAAAHQPQQKKRRVAAASSVV